MKRAFLLLGLAALTACGGAGGSTTPLVTTTSAPTPTPTPQQTAPPNPLTTSTSSLQFTAAGYTLLFTASETGYSGALSAKSSDCSGIATFSPASGTGPSANFGVVSVAAGKCHVTVTDSSGATATVTVDVTTVSGTIQ